MKPLAVVVTLMLLVACEQAPKITPSTKPDFTPGVSGSDRPSQISFNTSMNFSSGGMLRAVLHAGRVEQYDIKRYTWLDSGVRVDFYNRDGLHSSVLTSHSARINMVNNNMTAYGSVHIVSDSGTTVDTDSLEWDNKAQSLHSEAAVHIVERNGRITDGVGFESDQSLEHYRIMRPVIVTPSAALQSSGPNTLFKPAQPAVPGARAINRTIGLPRLDSGKR